MKQAPASAGNEPNALHTSGVTSGSGSEDATSYIPKHYVVVNGLRYVTPYLQEFIVKVGTSAPYINPNPP